MKWLTDPVGVPEMASHFMRLLARLDVRDLSISTSNFASSTIAECITHSANKSMVLAPLRELVMLLASERDLVQLLRTKARAAVLDKKPFVEIQN